MKITREVTAFQALKLFAWACACAGSAPALGGDNPSAPAVQTVAGWNELVEGLRVLPDRLLAKLPLSMQNDPQVRAEIGRLMLEALASSTLDAVGSDGDYPVFLPQIGQILNVGQPNADTVYRAARISQGGTYRLRGQRGTLRMANLTQVPAPPTSKSSQPVPARREFNMNTLRADAAGNFDLLLSATRPADYKGDWWELDPTAERLLLRMVSADWSNERDMTLSIERVDKPMGRPRRSATDLEQRLRQLPAATAFIASLFVDHVEQLRSQGFVNKLKVFDTTQIGGLATQFYYEGAYELRGDEALIVEAKVPARCVYSSMILTNDLYETTDWYNNHSSLNDSQAKPDADGVLRIVVSTKDPGVPNWLDTAGYARGVIQGRWTQCDTQPIPSVRKVALADVRKSLPRETNTITLAERDRIIRERRLALQQRPLW